MENFIIIIFVEKGKAVGYTYVARMEKQTPQITIFDVSKGLGYYFCYRSVIGTSSSKKVYPYLSKFSTLRPQKTKKHLYF